MPLSASRGVPFLCCFGQLLLSGFVMHFLQPCSLLRWLPVRATRCAWTLSLKNSTRSVVAWNCPCGCLMVNIPCSFGYCRLSYSSDSSRVRLPRDPISRLSSIALLSISSSSYAPRLFMVARRFVLSLCFAVLSFLPAISGFEERGDDRLEAGSGTGT